MLRDLRGTDRGAQVRCRIGGTDVNAWMVSQGWALASPMGTEAFVVRQDDDRSRRPRKRQITTTQAMRAHRRAVSAANRPTVS